MAAYVFTPRRQPSNPTTPRDSDRDGASAALRNRAKAVKFRSLPGYPMSQVVDVQVTDDAWSVLISEAAPEQLAQELRGAGLLNAGEQ
jgi:hypothetical protein